MVMIFLFAHFRLVTSRHIFTVDYYWHYGSPLAFSSLFKVFVKVEDWKEFFPVFIHANDILEPCTQSPNVLKVPG